MASEYDATEFVDTDFKESASPFAAAASGNLPRRAPSTEEVDLKVSEAQQKLAELKRAQEQLEQQRTQLEETRRRQSEFQTGRREMIDNLTRGVGLLEEAEFAARQDAEQMAKALAGLRDALEKVSAINEQSWTDESFQVELTRALTTLENARMEWNSSRLKFPVLSGERQREPASSAQSGEGASFQLSDLSMAQACKLGLALTWPVAVVILGALITFIVLSLYPA